MPDFETIKERYGPKILSIALHGLFIFLLIFSSKITRDNYEKPRYIEVQIGTPYSLQNEPSTENTNSLFDFSKLSYPQQQSIAQPEEEQLIEQPEIEQSINPITENQADLLPSQAQQKIEQQTQKPAFEISVQDEQEIVEKPSSQSKQNTTKGELNGNSEQGQDSATYLEWLQLTVQETSQIPLTAREKNISGKAVLRLTFNRDGYVSKYGLIRKTGSNLLDEAALNVAKKLMREPFPPMPTDFEQGKKTVTYDFPISFEP